MARSRKGGASEAGTEKAKGRHHLGSRIHRKKVFVFVARGWMDFVGF
jgi:hypothetical protein